MAFFSSESRGTPLVDSEMSEAMRRRLGELIGLGWGALAVLLGLCLAGYDINDSSPFSSTAAPPANFLGPVGAFVADPMMRAFGIASWTLVAFLGVWAVRFLLHLGESRVARRALFIVPALLIATAFASTHAPWESWQLSSGLGGFVGDTVIVSLIGMLPMEPTAAVQFLSLVFGAGLIAAAGAALGIVAAEAWLIVRWMTNSLLLVAWQCFRELLGLLRALVARIRAWRARPRSERMAPAEPTGSWKAGAIKERMLAAKRTRGEPSMTRNGAIGYGRRDRVGDDDGYADPEIRNQTLNSAIRVLTGIADEPDAPLPGPRPKHGPIEVVAMPGAGLAPSPVAQRMARPGRISRTASREQQPLLFESLNNAEAYDAPPLGLLEKSVQVIRPQTSGNALHENARMLETVLEDYGVRGEITAVKPGPVVTLYELEPAPGLKASRIIGLSDDIARSMSALSARVSTMPGRSVIGIELPNVEREKVLLREVLECPAYGDSQIKLALALGKDISGQPVVANLAKMPHLLIAGTTGSGKSVAINTMILSLLYRLSPKQCRMIMIDPKMLELSVYDDIPHLLAPVVTDPKKAVVALKWVVAEMEERYRRMSKFGVRNIDGYNARVREALKKGEDFSRVVQTGFDQTTGEPIYESESLVPEEMPLIVVIVDEMADLMMVAGKEIEACIQRLAQMARASGIHLIMATQRPSVDVITGTIKANFPTRISFQVTSKIDSRTILGEQGAEQLLGMGDMLYMAGGGRITRVHGPFVSDEEVEEVVQHLKSLGVPEYEEAVTEGGDEEAQALVDERLGLAVAGDDDATLYDKAVAIVARDRKCSTSYIQRKLAIGYNKAARLVEMMESNGVVSPANAVGKRNIMVEDR
jgi:S-DNA-T family DNA segregation ATPase FtsK/SpoIIIE